MHATAPLPLAAAPHHSLEDWRGRIDAIDAALVHLLNLRIEYARGAGRAKRAQGAPLQAPAREGEVLARVQALNPGPLDPQALAAIYRAILHASLQAQERERVLEGR